MSEHVSTERENGDSYLLFGSFYRYLIQKNLTSTDRTLQHHRGYGGVFTGLLH